VPLRRGDEERRGRCCARRDVSGDREHGSDGRQIRPAESGARTIRGLRTLLALIALGLALALAGCGGGSDQTAGEAAIPRAVAEDLAAKSDAIAEALDAGDVCGAAQLADDLKGAIASAVAGGRVPPELQQDLQRTATDLQNEVNCTQEKGNKGKGKGKGKGHAEEATTSSVTTTLSTTTEEGN
jgi:hypothetical protein